MNELYIGLMSGTSADGIDAVLADFNHASPKLLHRYYHPFSSGLRQSIIELCQSGADEIKRMGDLDITLGHAFADAVHALLKDSKTSFKEIRAIGCHGQTIRHYPDRCYTLQIGDPNIITAKTNITTITDFRRRDMAHGGQGAPLVPAFHQAVFAKKNQDRAIVNIGGIANVTLLFGNKRDVIGFDTGPGNILLDAWIERHLQQTYDKEGAWASKGEVNFSLLEKLLEDSFFHLLPPKSTGREYFNLNWLEKYISTSLSAVDVQATLVALTAQSIMTAIKKYFSQGEIIVCGGGAQNKLLMDHLRKNAAPLSVCSTHEFGIDPDWVEAIAFAWLAKQTLSGQTSNITTVTGAKQTAILGGIYQV
jgi:anhydro-N-acetylmuramic acid kinase